MKTLIFSISDEAFELLKSIAKGAAEYRDTEYETLEEFKSSEEFKEGRRTVQGFLDRNHGGTYHLITELVGKGLVESDGMSWHMTYVITEFGRQILENEMNALTTDSIDN